jgi:hypothetical protein
MSSFREKPSIASATKPRYQARRAASIWPSRPRPVASALANHALVGVGERGVAEDAAGFRHLAVRQVDRGGGRPLGLKHLPHAPDRGTDHGQNWIAVPGEGDRRLERRAQWDGAVVAKHQQPGVHRTRHDRCKQTHARYQTEAQPAIGLDGRGLRRRTLAADDAHPVLARAVEEDGQVPARAVQMRLDYL